jgi:hypothetical protein
MEIDITDFFTSADPFEFSASIAERGQNAGPQTWTNAKEQAANAPLLQTKEETAAWSAVECNALFIQLVSGDMRESGLDDDPDDDDWRDYEKGAEDGRFPGNIFRSSDRIYYSLSN